MTWLGEQLGRIADEMPERDLGAKAIAVYQRRRRNVMALAVAAVVAVTLLAATAGVRALSAGPQAAARPSSPPEQSQLTVGVVPSVESAPVFVALGKGYFEEEGLRVKPHIIVSAAHAVPMAESGRLDLAQTDYVTLFTANQAGKKFKIVSSLHQAAQGSLALVVDAKSKIRTMSDLKGKKVMVPALIGLGPLALAGVLKRAGLTLRDVLLIEMPFPEMIHALKSGRAHAALLAEPYVTRGLETGQARVVADAMTRDFANLHTAGMAATGRWAQENPRTLAAFERALAKARHLIASDPQQARDVLPTYMKIDATTAARATLGSYPARLDLPELQRVADLSLAYRFLKRSADAGSAVVKGG